METEHVPCESPDYSSLKGKLPPGYSRSLWTPGARCTASDGLSLVPCGCGLLVLHAPCVQCGEADVKRQLAVAAVIADGDDVDQLRQALADALEGSETRPAPAAQPPPQGNRPLVLAGVLALFVFVYLGEAISTNAPRSPVDARVLD